MTEQSAERRNRERLRLVLAQSDMDQVAVAARRLAEGPRMNRRAERVMWTGIVVTYARPFNKSNRLGAVSGRIVKLTNPMQKSLHERMCELRDELFAHNDETELRQVVEVSRSGSYSESYTEMDKGALRDIAELATEFEARFASRLDEIRREQQADP
jgi:hypothetical protein